MTVSDITQWRVLTIKQPWASSIFWRSNLRKDVENRTWDTRYRGPLIIHAGAGYDKAALAAERGIYKGDALRKAEATRELTARIIGIVELSDIVQDSDSYWALKGQHNWLLSKPKMLNIPIEGVKGKLGLWRPDASLARKILRGLA